MLTEASIRQFIARQTAERTGGKQAVPRISIVMPSYNQAEFIERSIRSVLNQDYPDIELIIIDGGSSDRTVDIIKRYSRQLAYWVSEKDQGQAHALNKGFEKATGDIYGWLNSDDIYLPGAFEKAAPVFCDPSAKIVYGNWLMIDGQDRITEKTLALPLKKPASPYENMNISGQAMFWRAEIHKKFGRFDQNLHRALDYDLIIDFLLKNGLDQFYYLDEWLAAFRRHPGQKTKADKTLADEVRYLEKKFGFPPQQSLGGICRRLSYRFYQGYHSLLAGGPGYTAKKLLNGLKRNKGF